MRVAIVDVRSAAVRSVVAETTSRGTRRVMDRTVAIGRPRALADSSALAPGTMDLLRETARRFRDAHQRLRVARVALSIDDEARARLDASGTVAALADALDAEVLHGGVAAEAAALARAAAHHRALDHRPTLLVELGAAAARVAHLERGHVRAAARVPARDLGALATLAGPRAGDTWLDVAVAAATPLVAAVPSSDHDPVRLVVTGPPARALARIVASREWRRPLRAADRVHVSAPAALALTSDLGAGPPGNPPPGIDGPELTDATGAAVVLSGLLAVTGAPGLLVTDADRVEGHLLALLGVAGVSGLAGRLVAAAGDPTPHATHVARLATRLFDGLAPLVGLGPEDREVLEAAALCHDLTREEGPGHHRRAAERLLALDVAGVSPARLVEVVCLVRSQRGRPPGPHVPVFLRLPPARRVVVERLVALLRVADGLDRGGDGAVQDLHVSVDRRPGALDHDAPLVCVAATGEDLDLALYGARGQARYVEHALGVRLVVRAAARPVVAT